MPATPTSDGDQPHDRQPHDADPAADDPVADVLHDLQDRRNDGWVFCPVGNSEDDTAAWHAMELGLGFLTFNNIDKAIYWFHFAAQHDYPAAEPVHTAVLHLRDALFQSELDHLTDEQVEPGAGLRQATQDVADSVINAAQAVADMLVGNARAEAQTIIDKARSHARYRHRAPHTPDPA